MLKFIKLMLKMISKCASEASARINLSNLTLYVTFAVLLDENWNFLSNKFQYKCSILLYKFKAQYCVVLNRL